MPLFEIMAVAFFGIHTTPFQRPLMSSKTIVVGCGNVPELRDAVATHPFAPHTDRRVHVSLPGGSIPCSSLPDRSMLGPKETL